MNLVTQPSIIDNNGSSDKLGTKKGMVNASININSLLPHVDEMKYLLKSQGIDFLAKLKLMTNYPIIYLKLMDTKSYASIEVAMGRRSRPLQRQFQI